MQCYTELTAPTAVTHSLWLPLTSARSHNLVVARASLVQVFATTTVSAELDAAAQADQAEQAEQADDGAQPQAASSSMGVVAADGDGRLGLAGGDDDKGLEAASFLGGDAALVRSDRGALTKLVLVAEFPLAGTVIGLARIKLAAGRTKSGGEALLLALKDARLSLVEWDPERRELATLSIHYYEQDELQGAPWAPPLSDYTNVLVADPGSRCAALKFGARNLAILPFRQPDDEDMDEEEEEEEEEDWDEELDGPRPAKKTGNGNGNGKANGPNAGTIEDSPFAPSFVLRLSNLSATLLHPVHLAFLHEYREPTFGILGAPVAPSAVLGRRDTLSYMVFTLDLQQKASTTILSVPGLPQDLFRVFALPPPVGGALLLGTNELIHIDQAGRANGVAVNSFTKQCTSFGLADQSELDLRLEGSSIEVLSPETGELLLVLQDGQLVLVTLQIDGRNVSGVRVQPVSPEAGGDILLAGVTSLSPMGRHTMFAGSEQADPVVFGWSRKQQQGQGSTTTTTTRRRAPDDDGEAHDDDDDDDDDEEEEEEAAVDDDDLYGDGPASSAVAPGRHGRGGGGGGGGGSGELRFRVHDSLLSLAPIRDMTFGKPAPPEEGEAAQQATEAKTRSDLNLVLAVGRGRGGALALVSREINAEAIGVFAFAETHALWTVSASKPVPKALQGAGGASAATATVGDDYDAATAQYDEYLIAAMVDEDGTETSNVYAVTGTGFEKLAGTEFEPAAGFTVHAGTMGNRKRIVQVLRTEVRCYDGDLGLSQILPMVDEDDTGAEPQVVGASIADPYLLLVRDDGSAVVAEVNKDYELEEVEREEAEALTGTKWVAGCLYADGAGVFRRMGEAGGRSSILLFLLSEAGKLCIFSLPDLKLLYAVDHLRLTPPVLSPEYSARRGLAEDTIKEILVADLGDAISKTPYLIVRHTNDDLSLYEPVVVPTPSGEDGSLAGLRFLKRPNATFAKSTSPDTTTTEEDNGDDTKMDDADADVDVKGTPPPTYDMPMRAFDNIGGYSTVVLPGRSASFVVKSAQSMPKVVPLRGGAVRSVSAFHTAGCDHGFIYVDGAGTARVSRLPRQTRMAELGVCVRKVALGAEASAVAYHGPSGAYVVASSTPEPFALPKDEAAHRAEWAKEATTTNNVRMRPRGARGRLQLVSAGRRGRWTVVDSVALEANEVVLCVETLSLEVSEATNERRQLVAVGTAVARGEDLAVRGRVHVYDVVAVIPEPGRPETGRKLKRVAREEIPRGAVTAVAAIGTQGLMLVAQGQKCMVRGLKEDGTLLPVAFLDMSCYVTSAKELPGTGLCVLADAFKGVWLVGYTEEPYRMVVLGKSHTRLEAVHADVLPDGPQLLVVVADADGNLHVLQFDPEHPRSLQGQLLLHRATFCTGAHVATKMVLLPSTGGEDAPKHHLLLASPTGMLAQVAPLAEADYRPLASLAGQLATALSHTAGLNPKGYRMVAGGSAATLAPGVDAAVGRSVVDGALLARWTELGAGRQAEIAGRVGLGDAAAVRAVLGGVLGWARMGYF